MHLHVSSFDGAMDTILSFSFRFCEGGLYWWRCQAPSTPLLLASASYWTFVSTISSDFQATKWGRSDQPAWLPSPVILLPLPIYMFFILSEYTPRLPISLTKHGLQQQLYRLEAGDAPAYKVDLDIAGLGVCLQVPTVSCSHQFSL